MDKKDILKLVVLLAVLVMVGGMFSPALFFGSGKSGDSTSSGDVVSGVLQFNGSIRTYEPVLLTSGQMPEAIKNELSQDKRINSISPSASGYLINLSSRDAVFPVADYLSKRGINTTTVANVILPSSVDLTLANGSKMEIFASGAVQLITEPFVDTDTMVVVRMSASAQNGRLIKYSTPEILSDYLDIRAESSISALLGKEYSYTIPWESRNDINTSMYQNASYEKADYISFPGGLSVSEITEMAKLPYVTYITDVSATVNDSFANRSMVEQDFGNISIVYPDSALTVITNDALSLPFNGSVLNSYLVEVPGTVNGYSLDTTSYNLSSSNEYSVNDTVNVTIIGRGIGNRVVRIDSVTLD